MLGLPDGTRGCLFDLDGVITKTAALHAAAWTKMFNEFLHEQATQTGQPFVPFDPVRDYEQNHKNQILLEAAHIEDLFELRIDGIVGKRDHLRGKPAPDDGLRKHGADVVVTDLAELLSRP